MRPPKDVEVNHTPTGIYWIPEDGIIRALMGAQGYATTELRKKSMKDFLQKLGNKKHCIIVDITDAAPLTREVQTFNLENYPKMFKAIAFISRSAYSKMLGHVFLGMHSNVVPFKIFSGEEEALEWIRQYND